MNYKNIFIMSSLKTWNDIISEIEKSGLDIVKKRQAEVFDRKARLKQQYRERMRSNMQQRMTVQREKSKDRNYAQLIDRTFYEVKRKQRDEYRQKQLFFQNENERLTQDRIKIIKQNKQMQAERIQNGITLKLMSGNDSRLETMKKENRLCDTINYELINLKNQEREKIKRVNNQEGKKFQDYIESTFRQIDEKRLKFKRHCLDSGLPSGRIATQPDSLQKEYSYYLSQQVSDKTRLKTQAYNGVGDEFLNDQMKKMNTNPEIQSASPAYIGRIPLHHDRQKQLRVVDQVLSRNGKSNLSFKPNEQFQINVQSFERPKRIQNFRQREAINLSTKERDRHRKNPGIEKDFKLYNIITNKTNKISSTEVTEYGSQKNI